jgi:hypothetical protein
VHHATFLPAKPCRPHQVELALASPVKNSSSLGASTMVQPVVIEALSGTVGAMTALTLTYPLMAVRPRPARKAPHSAGRRVTIQRGAQPVI